MDKEACYLRFRESIEYLRNKGRVHKQQDIADAIGISKSYMSDVIYMRGGKFSEDFLKRFAAAYSDYINEEWLLTGEGEMAKPERSMRPHIGAKARAGFMDGLSERDYGEDLRPAIPFFGNYDFTIKATGDSMEPKYAEGDILVCRVVTDRLNPPIGKVCVLDTKDGAVVKEIKRVTEEGVLLHSFNENYSDYELTADNINQIAVVIGSLIIDGEF